MRKNWHERGGKRLGGILKKARDNRTQNGKPKWMGDAAWKELTDYWDSPEFLAKSAQAKANQASKKGGALHTTGPISHVEVAENMASELNRPVDLTSWFVSLGDIRMGVGLTIAQRRYIPITKRLYVRFHPKPCSTTINLKMWIL